MSKESNTIKAEPQYRVEVVGPDAERCRDLVTVLSSQGFAARVHASGLVRQSSQPDAYVLDIDGFSAAAWSLSERKTLCADIFELAGQADAAVVGIGSGCKGSSAEGFDALTCLIDLRHIEGLRTKLVSAIRLGLLHAEVRLRRASFAAAGLSPPVSEVRQGRVLFAGLPTHNFLALAAAFARRGRRTVAALSASSAIDMLHDDDCSLLVLGSFGSPERSTNLLNIVRHSPRLSQLQIALDESCEVEEPGYPSVRGDEPVDEVAGWLERLMMEAEQQRALKFEASSCAIGVAGDVSTRLFTPQFAIHHIQRQIDRARATARPLSIAVLMLEQHSPEGLVPRTASPSVFCQAAQLVRHLLRGSDLACRLDWQSLLVSMPGETVAGARVMAHRLAEMFAATAFSDADDMQSVHVDMRASILELEPGLDARTMVRLAVAPFADNPAAA